MQELPPDGERHKKKKQLKVIKGRLNNTANTK